MAFNIQSWGIISGAANNRISTLQNGNSIGAPNLCTYVSVTDTIATIEAADYFAGVASDLNVGDFIYAVGSDGNAFLTVSARTVQPASVTVSFGVVTGDVAGPASSTDNALARFDGTTGKVIQNSVGILSDAGALSGLSAINAISGLTASRAVVTDGSKNLASSGTSATELGYVTGVTSAIQTQLNGKVSLSGANVMAAASTILLDKAPGTESSNAVTINKQAGVITTTSLTTAGGATETCTLTNSEIVAGSVVLATVGSGTNTATENYFMTTKVDTTAHTATFVITNNTVATPLDGTLVINFAVF